MKNLSVFYFFYYLGMSMYSPFLSLYFESKGFNGTATGLLLSAWAVAGVVSPLVMGMINDRLRNPLTLLRVCVVVMPVIGLGFYFSGGYAVCLALAILFSWFSSSAMPLTDSAAVQIGSREGFSFSSVRLWGALSYAIGSFVTGFIYKETGYPVSFLIFFAMSIPILVSMLRLPAVPRSSGKRPSLLEQAGTAARNRPFLLFVFMGFLLMTSMAVNSSFLPLYFREKGFDLGFVGTAYSVAALIEVPMFGLSARLVGRFGRFPILAFAAGCYAVKCFCLFAFDNMALTMALQVLDGVSYALFAGVAVEVVNDLSDEKSKATSQAAFAALTYGLGGIIGNASGGAVLEVWGGSTLYLLLFGMSLCATVLLIAARKWKGFASASPSN